MKKLLVSLGIIGFVTSLTVTVGILKYPEALDAIKTSILNTSSEPILNTDQAQIDYEALLGSSDSQVFELEKLYKDNPSEENLILYAHALIQNKSYDSASDLLRNATDNNQTAWLYNGLILASKENDEEAKKAFQKALALSGNNPPALIQNFLNAYTDFESQQDGQRIYLNALLTKAYIDAGEYGLAEDMALKIVNEKSDYRDVWILLGYAYMKTGKYADAEGAFLKAKSIDSVKPEIHYFLGLARYLQDNFSGAVEEFELAILYGFEPRAEAYKKIADGQTKLGLYQDALSSYEYLLNIDQSKVELFEIPIKIAIENVKDLERALTLANLANTNFPNEALSWALTAEVYLAKNELGSAQNAIDTALGLNSKYAEAYFTKGKIGEAQKDIASAKEAYKRAYEFSTQGDALNRMSAERYNALILPTN